MPVPPSGLEPEAWVALDAVSGLGPEKFRRLLAAFGSPRRAIDAGYGALQALVGAALATAIESALADSRVVQTMRWLEGPRHHLLTLADDDYPAALLETADPPPVLYLSGNRGLLGQPCIAIVGSRNATAGGLATAEAFGASLSTAGLTIVSGLALGIDAAAHRGGLSAAGRSIAVVGTGLDRIYPARNRALAHELAENGLILSEFPLGTPALAANFPRRNRIISGLSRGVLVVEAALASGSLITARLAGEQGRDVFAIPGSIHSPLSKGCHLLIKQGAKLVDDAQDILTELGVAPGQQERRAAPPPDADPLLASIGYDPVSIDTLSTRLKLDVSQVSAALIRLEIDGWIAALPGGKVQRIR